MSHVCFSCSSRVQRDPAAQQGLSRALRRFFREMYVTHSHQRWIGVIAVLIALTGCSQKPPGCADPEVHETIRHLLKQEGPHGVADKDPIAAEILEQTKLTFTNVVSEGYQADAKKQLCRATLEIQDPDGKNIVNPVVYTTQLTVDKPGEFLVAVDEADVHRVNVSGGLADTAFKRRWSGNWSGDLVCEASSRSGAPNPEAFTERISAVIQGGDVTVPLSGREGVTLVNGFMDRMNDYVSLGSERRDGQPKLVKMVVVLRPRGEQLAGRAEYVDMGHENFGKVYRSCTVSLGKGTAPAGTVARPGEQRGWPGTYAGEGDGDVTFEVKPPGADKRYPVLLSTNTARTGGGCGGSVSGFATESGDELRIVAEADGQRCEAVAKRTGSSVELEEGAGCTYFHGPACGFSARLNKLQ